MRATSLNAKVVQVGKLNSIICITCANDRIMGILAICDATALVAATPCFASIIVILFGEQFQFRRPSFPKMMGSKLDLLFHLLA